MIAASSSRRAARGPVRLDRRFLVEEADERAPVALRGHVADERVANGPHARVTLHGPLERVARGVDARAALSFEDLRPLDVQPSRQARLGLSIGFCHAHEVRGEGLEVVWLRAGRESPRGELGLEPLQGRRVLRREGQGLLPGLDDRRRCDCRVLRGGERRAARRARPCARRCSRTRARARRGRASRGAPPGRASSAGAARARPREFGSTFSAASACEVARSSSPRIVSLAMASSMCARASPTASRRSSSAMTRVCSTSISAPECDTSAGSRTGIGSGVREPLSEPLMEVLSEPPGRGGGPLRGTRDGAGRAPRLPSVAGAATAASRELSAPAPPRPSPDPSRRRGDRARRDRQFPERCRRRRSRPPSSGRRQRCPSWALAWSLGSECTRSRGGRGRGRRPRAARANAAAKKGLFWPASCAILACMRMIA